MLGFPMFSGGSKANIRKKRVKNYVIETSTNNKPSACLVNPWFFVFMIV